MSLLYIKLLGKHIVGLICHYNILNILDKYMKGLKYHYYKVLKLRVKYRTRFTCNYIKIEKNN